MDRNPVSEHRCGFVAIVGRPNVGKSTLLNALLKTKIAIVTPKPQTTRDRILGILTRPGFQALFLDTPGIHQPHRALNRRMLQVALTALADSDVVLAMTDACDPDVCLTADEPVMERAIHSGRPVVLALNKVDRMAKPALLPWMDAVHRRWNPHAIVPVSALSGDGLEALLSEVVSVLPEGPPLYPADQLSDCSVRFLVSEIIREKVFLFTHQEVPYSTAVRIEQFEEAVPPSDGAGEGLRKGRGVTRIAATILVERPSHKRIIVGKGGTMIRRIGQAAREEVEALLDQVMETGSHRRSKVFLELFVRVEEDWTRTDEGLRRVES